MARCSVNSLLKADGVTVFYRGVNRIYPPETRHIPSLYYPPNEFYKHEDDIFREVISLFPDEMLARRSTVEKLFLTQHYRFPARLLDISKNPLTDLFLPVSPTGGGKPRSRKTARSMSMRFQRKR